MLMTVSATSFLFAIAFLLRAKAAAREQNQKALFLSVSGFIFLAVLGGGFIWLAITYPNAIPMATTHHVG